jgi:MoaA/NifB/PqqE/SkfB family radical SAM enzyme
MFRIFDAQKFIPARLKYSLKPYYRKIFPNKLHAFLHPTYRCNYKCSYCPVVTKYDLAGIWGHSSELTARQWHDALERLPPTAIYITGGEPFLYRDLPELINGMSAKHSLVGMVTNLSVPVHVYRRIESRIHLNASFHREFTTQEDFIEKIRALKDHFHLCVNIVATPENLPVLENIRSVFGDHEIDLHVDPYLDPEFRYTAEQRQVLDRYIRPDRSAQADTTFDDFSTKQCSAGRNYIHLSPDGGVYTCSSGLGYLNSPQYEEITTGRDLSVYRMGNICSPDFELHATDMVCSLPCFYACDRDLAIIKPAAASMS